MDFFSSEQVWGIVMLFLGMGILDLCSRLERQDEEWLKDPRNRYRKCRRKNDFAIPTTVRGVFLSFTGSLLSVTGIMMFFLHIK